MEEKNQAIVHPPLKLLSYDIFLAISRGEIMWAKVYCLFFDAVPNIKTADSIHAKKISKWIEANLGAQIVRRITREFDREEKIYNEVAYILSNRIIIFVNNHEATAEILFSDQEKEAQSLLVSLRKCKQKKRKQSICLVIPNDRGLGLEELKYQKPKLQLARNYNDDLCTLHDEMIKKLRKSKASGLTLFHGIPGTGKTTYLRHLVSCINKKIIFFSPRLAGKMDDPHFTKLLIENQNTVIIIEDAEELLVSRNRENNSGISMLLNLTDGLLGSSLNIQFICTFNTHINNIDQALLRKGRLMALYEFKPLSIEKSKALMNELGKDDFHLTEPMTLANIYNAGETNYEFEKKSNPIGFAVKAA